MRGAVTVFALDHRSPQRNLTEHAGDATKGRLGGVRADTIEWRRIDSAIALGLWSIMALLAATRPQPLMTDALGCQRFAGRPERSLHDAAEDVFAVAAHNPPDAPRHELLDVIRHAVHSPAPPSAPRPPFQRFCDSVLPAFPARERRNECRWQSETR